jgi:hypothetical protein
VRVDLEVDFSFDLVCPLSVLLLTQPSSPRRVSRGERDGVETPEAGGRGEVVMAVEREEEEVVRR